MFNARRETDAIRLESASGPRIDERIAVLAARQHGVVALRQLVVLGLTQRAAAHRAAVGRLHRVHRGVYAVGHPLLSRHGHWMAAVLAAGPGAALSHTSAAALWQLRPTAATRIDVTVPSAAGRQGRRGLRIHRTPTLRPDEVTEHENIPVTTPARTLLDLAATLSRRTLERALDQSEILDLFDLTSLTALATTHAGERGGTALARALTEHEAGTTVTRSELEERFLTLCERHAIERPQPNARVCGLEVDFLFAKRNLVVEVDGYRYHRSRRAFERDRERDAILAAAGLRTLRFSHRQVTQRPREVATAITK